MIQLPSIHQSAFTQATPKFGRVLKQKKDIFQLSENPVHQVLKPAVQKQKKSFLKGFLKMVGAIVALPLTVVSGFGYMHNIRPHANQKNAEHEVTSVQTIKDAQGKPIAIVDRVEGVSQDIMLERAQANTYIYGPVSAEGRISFGSGFTVKGPDGLFYIITNNHVVDGNTIEIDNAPNEMNIKMYGQNDVIRASVLTDAEGKEIRSAVPDVAVLKLKEGVTPSHYIDMSNFRNLKIDPLKTGEPVFLVGNQSGLRDTVTTGIVSSTHEYRVKELSKFETLKNIFKEKNFNEATTVFVQTDASCNGGGSGGALYDAQGRLIGIHTWHTDDYTNLCFSIRVDEVLNMFQNFGVLQPEVKDTPALIVVNP